MPYQNMIDLISGIWCRLTLDPLLLLSCNFYLSTGTVIKLTESLQLKYQFITTEISIYNNWNMYQLNLLYKTSLYQSKEVIKRENVTSFAALNWTMDLSLTWWSVVLQPSLIVSILWPWITLRQEPIKSNILSART